jgi:hypothetical protein
VSPDTRRHRGAHPDDKRLFGETHLDRLRAAVQDLSWLLSRGYAVASALKLCGDRYQLNERQRIAVARAACSDTSLERRSSTRVPVQAVAGQALVIDGFNLLITIEAALSGGALLLCRDGCIRDMSSVHGSYRSVEETEAALRLVGDTLEARKPAQVLWLLDSPISNSGRLAQRISEAAHNRNLEWDVQLVYNPDREIINSSRLAVTSDSTILNGAGRWVDLASHVVREHAPGAWIVDVSGDSPAGKVGSDR